MDLYKNHKVKKKVQKLLKVGCEGCGQCCTNSIVPITPTDAKRIMKRTGLKAEKFVGFYHAQDIDFEDDSPFWIQLPTGKRAMAIKKEKQNDPCPFLDKDKRCTIYTDRPATCRTFPISLELNRKNVIVKASLNKLIDKKYPKADEPKDFKKLYKESVQEDQADDRFFTIIEKWNDLIHRGDEKAFLKFCGLAPANSTK